MFTDNLTPDQISLMWFYLCIGGIFIGMFVGWAHTYSIMTDTIKKEKLKLKKEAQESIKQIRAKVT
jgi:uncharacterized membrane protein SpoIIM required for sporulation